MSRTTARSGYDIGYPWRGQGQARAGEYYMGAAEAGEPPGLWWGPGAEALGFAPGQVVQREPYNAVYQQTDPRTGEKMGRSPGSYTRFEEHLARLQSPICRLAVLRAARCG